MEFYRSLKNGLAYREVAKKALKHKRRTAFFVVASLVAVYVLVHNNGVIARVRLEMKKSEMAQKIQAAEAENKRLQAQVKALEGDKKTVETIAREKYGMAKPGEKVYRVRKD